MLNNKKTLVISWLIGIGCGLFFSGIILSILLYTVNKTSPIPKEISKETVENQNEVAPQGNEEEKIILSIEEKETMESENIKMPVEVIDKNEEPHGKKDKPQTIELNIQAAATAHDITKILVENNIISDYDGFIDHIVLHDAERSLAHGIITFPLNSDIETVFKILRP